MNIKISFLCLFFLSITALGAKATAVDSLGIRVIDGEKYIIHKLEPKETLYALGKRYHVSVAEIQEINPEEKDGYRIDQIGRELLIPFKPEEFSTFVQNTGKSSESKRHTVAAGETIYSISRQYKVSQDDIIKWNDLESTTLDIGQKLWVLNPSSYPSGNEEITSNDDVDQIGKLIHTVDLGETIYSISKQYDVRQSDIIELNNLKDNNIAVGQKLIVKAETVKAPVQETEKEDNYKKDIASSSVHKANSGENYEILANIYGLRETELKSWNDFSEPFEGGEEIRIVAPEKTEKDSEESVTSESEVEATVVVDNQRIHTVGSGETLYSLSEEYGVEVEDLRRWNNLSNYQLSLGQKLYIQNPDALIAETSSDSVETKPPKDIEVPKSRVSENPQKKDTKAFFTVEEDEMPTINKIKETGIAEVIEGSEGTEKYLALHRTAKIGTIMQVRNDLNDQIVFVRVLGKLPNTGVDKKVIIKISKKAFEKLGGVDYKFPVEISYLPLKD